LDLQLLPNDPTISTLYFWLCKIGDGLAIFVKDVSAQKKEERQLKQYQHIFDYMEEAIIVTDLDGNVIDWNPASERMFGYNKDQILGQSAFILTRTHKGEELDQENRGVHRDGDVWKSDYEFLRSDGSRGMAFTIFTMLKDDQGKPYGTVGICHDVTQQRRLEERLTFKTQELQEKNLALNTLLRHAESERIRACEQVATDLSRRLTGKLQHIVNSKNKPEKVENLAESILQDLGWTSETSEPDPKNPILKLTDKELEVARLIRLGKTKEEIAFVLDKSADTVRLQRISIRKKLGLGPKERNLSSFLKNFELA
jgi:PAS domain S-box-containing protein